jgi:hypothetical protein
MGHIVDVAVNGNGLGDERMITDARDIVKHRLPLVLDPMYSPERSPGPFSDVTKTAGGSRGAS